MAAVTLAANIANVVVAALWLVALCVYLADRRHR
jgi:hypothetical protein